MTASLMQLMEELLQSIEQRDAGDPDAPAWEACARIERLGGELARRIEAGETESGLGLPTDAGGRPRGDVLAGTSKSTWG